MRILKECSFQGCDRPSTRGGLCIGHWHQKERGCELRPLRYRWSSTPRPLLAHPLDPSLALVPLTRGLFAIVSIEDAAEVGQRNWNAENRDRTFYARTNLPDSEDGRRGHHLYLHRFVATQMGLSDDLLVDHKNRNGLDCSRRNLRPADDKQNGWNSGMRRNNTSGIKGVSWNSRIGRWKGAVRVGGETRESTFRTKEDAAAFVARIREEHHGEFARSN